MTAAKVIDEILQLPREEQLRVLDFALELKKSRQISGAELSTLAQQMVDSNDPAEVEKLKARTHSRILRRLTMPRIRRDSLPRPLWFHLLERVESRQISVDQLGLLADYQRQISHNKYIRIFHGDVRWSHGS